MSPNNFKRSVHNYMFTNKVFLQACLPHFLTIKPKKKNIFEVIIQCKI